MSQSASTPPPSPPMAKIAIVIGRVLVSNGAFIADFSGLCRQQLPTCQSLLQEPDYGVAHAGLEAIPPGRIVDDGSPVERRAQNRGVRDLAAQAAAHARVDHPGHRIAA